MRRVVATALLVLSITSSAGEITGDVVGVPDGDTVTVLTASKVRHVIRLSGIDAPEKRQAFGQRSKESLSDLVYERQVTVISHKKDRYGRLVGKVVLGGVDVNLQQVQRGMAWVYRDYLHELTAEEQELYLAAENEAKRYRLGLWSDSAPQAPWSYRRVNKTD